MAIKGHNKKLKWSNFKGKVPPDAIGDAFTSTNCQFTFKSSHDSQGYWLRPVSAQVILEEKKMWSRKNKRTAKLLKHEQGHFDIVALLGRDEYKKFTDDLVSPRKRFSSATALTDAIHEIHNSFRDLVPALNDVYDHQTKSGVNQAVQDNWDDALANARADPNLSLVNSLKANGIQIPVELRRPTRVTLPTLVISGARTVLRRKH